MDATLAARLPFEMLHCVRDVNFFPFDPRFFEGAIKDFSSRPDKWFSGDILLVAGLFAEKHECRAFRSLADDRLRGVFVERTSCATPRCFRDRSQTGGIRNWGGRPIRRVFSSWRASFHHREKLGARTRFCYTNDDESPRLLARRRRRCARERGALLAFRRRRPAFRR